MILSPPLQEDLRLKHEQLLDAHAKMKSRAKSLLGDLNQARQTIAQLTQDSDHARKLSDTEAELAAARAALHSQRSSDSELPGVQQERSFDLAAARASREHDGDRLSTGSSQKLADLESALLSDVPRDDQIAIMRRLQNADVETRLGLLLEAIELVRNKSPVRVLIRHRFYSFDWGSDVGEWEYG